MGRLATRPSVRTAGVPRAGRPGLADLVRERITDLQTLRDLEKSDLREIGLTMGDVLRQHDEGGHRGPRRAGRAQPTLATRQAGQHETPRWAAPVVLPQLLAVAVQEPTCTHLR